MNAVLSVAPQPTGSLPKSLATWPQYAAGQHWIGAPLWVEAWQQYVLERPIASTGQHDVVGVWPYMDRVPQHLLSVGFAELRTQGYVSFSGVYAPGVVLAAAPDFDTFRFFKQHFVHDPHCPLRALSHKSRYNIRRGRDTCPVHEIDLRTWFEQIFTMHDVLARARSFSPMAHFDREFLERLASSAHTRCFGAFGDHATGDAELLGFLIAVECLDGTHFLATATSAHGMRLRASYSLWSHALEQLQDRPVFFGGAPGLSGEVSGVGKFKQRFANAALSVYFVGKILQPEMYRELSLRLTADSSRELPPSSFFPLYRSRS